MGSVTSYNVASDLCSVFIWMLYLMRSHVCVCVCLCVCVGSKERTDVTGMTMEKDVGLRMYPTTKGQTAVVSACILSDKKQVTFFPGFNRIWLYKDSVSLGLKSSHSQGEGHISSNSSCEFYKSHWKCSFIESTVS